MIGVRLNDQQLATKLLIEVHTRMRFNWSFVLSCRSFQRSRIFIGLYTNYSRSTDGEAETQKEFRTKLKAIEEAKPGKPMDDVCVQFGISKSQ